MPIIKTHDVTLYGGNDIDVVLHPLCDGHLTYLYRWNADPEVLFWTEGGAAELGRTYDTNTVHQIYGGVSQNAFCFLIEAGGRPIGECWLQKMNLPAVKAMYPENCDVRRIDMAIGEKMYWGKGIGTQFLRMLIDFAFYGEHVDILHCFAEDYNVRSWHLWEKQGFKRVLSEPLPQPQKGKWQYHYRLTRQEFIETHRVTTLPNKIFWMPLLELQPSQLYISAGKLRLVREWFDQNDKNSLDAIPVKKIKDRIVMTDGHTRAVAAYLAGWNEIPVYWDEDDLSLSAYETDVKWCEDAGIHNPIALADRIVSHKDYERLWRKRCMEMNA